jgi:isopentenyl phosphate kinase
MGASERLVFLKLGGSLITDKTRPHTPRLDVLQRIAGELAAARQADPGLRLVLGHGSGSFGHVPAKRYGTRQGVQGPQGWLGFVEVQREAAALNQHVMQALAQAGMPALPLPPSAAALAIDGQVSDWPLEPLQRALQHGLLPVIYGDVVFDTVRGGTILSTEDLFDYLAPRLRPSEVLLAGLEPGVWADFPACTRLLDVLSEADLASGALCVGGSAAVDVTGGMSGKVQQGLALARRLPGLQVRIFSALPPGSILQALSGAPVGTLLQPL